MMSPEKYHRKWLRKHIRAIHRHDQCQAMVDELEAIGHPRASTVRNLQSMYGFLSEVAGERVDYYKKVMKSQ